MPRFDVAFIGTFEADTYEDALREAKRFSDGVNVSEPDVPFSYIGSYETDYDGQRVLYLHSENDDPIVGFGQDDEFPSVAAGEPVRESDIVKPDAQPRPIEREDLSESQIAMIENQNALTGGTVIFYDDGTFDCT